MVQVLHDSLLPNRLFYPSLRLDVERICLQLRDLCLRLHLPLPCLPKQFGEACWVVLSGLYNLWVGLRA